MNEQTFMPDASTDATAIDDLEHQVERASFDTHTAIGRNSIRLGEVESFLYGLIDVLLAKGQVLSDELAPPVEKVRREAASKGDVPAVGVALRVDGPTESQGSEVKVNCA